MRAAAFHITQMFAEAVLGPQAGFQLGCQVH
jgi:hypothetical protein